MSGLRRIHGLGHITSREPDAMAPPSAALDADLIIEIAPHAA
jgi:hypothetical protein